MMTVITFLSANFFKNGKVIQKTIIKKFDASAFHPKTFSI